MMVEEVDCIFEFARCQLGLDQIEFRAELVAWSGYEWLTDLCMGSSAEKVMARRRMLDRLIVMGLKHPSAGYISEDYAAMMSRLAKAAYGSEHHPELKEWLSRVGHPSSWPYLGMTGKTFQAIVGLYDGMGLDMPELIRNWMRKEHLAHLAEFVRLHRTDETRLSAMLRDYGGGALFPQYLDEAGFNRMVVAFEGLSSEAIRRTVTIGPGSPSNALQRYFPDWSRPRKQH